MENGVGDKVRRVRGMLSGQGLEGVVIRSQVNLAWLTGGRYFVNMAGESGCAVIVITPDEVLLVSNNIEADRLWREEAAAEVCDRMVVYKWYEKDEAVIREIARDYRLISDDALAGGFLQLRLVLTDEERKRYAVLGRLAGEAVGEVAYAYGPGETEYQIAGRLSGACLARGLEPVVCLVGGDERAAAFRHPLPTGKRVDKYAILVLSARKWGLHASVSRAVHFGPLPRTLADRQVAVSTVEAAYLAATRPGKTLGEIFGLARKAYVEAGYPGEWEYHHQGGLTGYQSREVKAAPDEAAVIESGQAVAWNPTIRGTKAEDTVLVTPDGPEFLTVTGDFPVQTVTAGGMVFQRPFILTR